MFTCSGALPKISHPIYRQLAPFQVVVDKQAEVQIDCDVIPQNRGKEIQKDDSTCTKSVGCIILRNYDEQTTNVEVLPDWLEFPRNVTVELWRHILMTNAMPLGK